MRNMGMGVDFCGYKIRRRSGKIRYILDGKFEDLEFIYKIVRKKRLFFVYSFDILKQNYGKKEGFTFEKSLAGYRYWIGH